VEALGNEESGVDSVRLVSNVGAVGCNKQDSVSSCGGFVRRRKIGPKFAFSGGEVEIDLDLIPSGCARNRLLESPCQLMILSPRAIPESSRTEVPSKKRPEPREADAGSPMSQGERPC
jgi:hypothetical protein